VEGFGWKGAPLYRKVDVRLPGKGNSNSHGARPVHLIITMIKWFRTSRLSIKNSLTFVGTRSGTPALLTFCRTWSRVQGLGFYYLESAVSGSGFRVQAQTTPEISMKTTRKHQWPYWRPFAEPGPGFRGYRGTSPIRKRPPLGPYSRAVPRTLRWS